LSEREHNLHAFSLIQTDVFRKFDPDLANGSGERPVDPDPEQRPNVMDLSFCRPMSIISTSFVEIQRLYDEC